MADVKKAAAAAKMAAKPVVETKETEVKAEVKKAAAKPAAKKAEAKPAAKKETVKKAAPAKKAAAKPAAKKAPAKKAEAIINFQFAGKEYKADDFVTIAKDVWKYDLGNKPADFKTVELYVKPEEAKVYYVINGDVTGDFDI